MNAVQFFDLPSTMYPVTMEFRSRETGCVVHEMTVARPGAIDIPPLVDVYGPLCLRMGFADGVTLEREVG